MNSDRLSFISVLYIITWCLSPPLAHGMVYRLIAIIAVLVLMFNSFQVATKVQKRYLYTAFFLCFYIVGISVMNGDPINIRVGTAIVLVTGAIYEMWIFKKSATKRRLYLIMFFSLALVCLWNTTSIIALYENPHIMRTLVKETDVSEIYAARGVGGFGYVNCVVAFLPVQIELFRKKDVGLFFKITLAYCIASSLMLSYMSQYFIALLLAILAVFLVWKKPGKITYIVVIVVMTFVVSFMEDILAFLIENVELPTLRGKLIDMQDILVNGGDLEDSDFGERFDRYNRDFDLIKKNPVYGCLKFDLVGKHSDFLDFFAQFGIPLGIVYVTSLLRPAILWSKRNFVIAPIVLLIAALMAVMNRFPLHVAVPMCFLLPTFCKYIQMDGKTIDK